MGFGKCYIQEEKLRLREKKYNLAVLPLTVNHGTCILHGGEPLYTPASQAVVCLLYSDQSSLFGLKRSGKISHNSKLRSRVCTRNSTPLTVLDTKLKGFPHNHGMLEET